MHQRYQSSELQHAENVISNVWPPVTSSGREAAVAPTWRAKLKMRIAREIRIACEQSKRAYILGLRQSPRLQRKK